MVDSRQQCGRQGVAGRQWAGVLLAAAVLLTPLTAAARTWVNRDGKTVQGTYLSVAGDKVRLRLSRDRREVEVPLPELSNADLEYVRQRQNLEAQGQRPPAAEDDAPAPRSAAPRGAAAETEGAMATVIRVVPFLGLLVELSLTTLVLTLAGGILCHAAFLLLGAKLVRLRGSYFEAIKATVLELILGAILFGFALGAINVAGALGTLLLLGVFLLGPIAVQVVYDTDFVLALLAYGLAIMLTLLTYVSFFYAVAAIGL